MADLFVFLTTSQKEVTFVAREIPILIPEVRAWVAKEVGCTNYTDMIAFEPATYPREGLEELKEALMKELDKEQAALGEEK